MGVAWKINAYALRVSNFLRTPRIVRQFVLLKTVTIVFMEIAWHLKFVSVLTDINFSTTGTARVCQNAIHNALTESALRRVVYVMRTFTASTITNVSKTAVWDINGSMTNAWKI